MGITLDIISLAFLLVLSAFFSGSETAFFSLSRFSLQRSAVKRERGSSDVSAMLSKPGKLLITILVGNMIVNVWATTLMTGLLLERIGPGAIPIVVVFMTVLILMFGEITPKVIAVEHNSLWARISAPFLRVIGIIIAPVRWLLQGITAIAQGRERNLDLRLDEVDIASALEIAHREGDIEGEYKELLLHFLSLNKVTGADIMIPRARLPLFDIDSRMSDVCAGFDEMHSDIAIIMGREGDRPRIIERRAVSLAVETDSPWDIAGEVEFVLESKPVSELFFDIRKSSAGRFIAIDEQGDVAGILETESVLLSIFGKRRMRDNIGLRSFSKIGGWFLVPSEIDLQAFNNAFGTSFESERYSTLGGFIVEQLGKIPSPGEEIEMDDTTIRIVKSDRRKIETVAVKRSE